MGILICIALSEASQIYSALLILILSIISITLMTTIIIKAFCVYSYTYLPCYHRICREVLDCDEIDERAAKLIRYSQNTTHTS